MPVRRGRLLDSLHGDLPNGPLAGADMVGQTIRRLAGDAVSKRFQNLGVLHIGGIYPIIPGEIQPPDNPQPVGDLPVNPRHLPVASGGHQVTVKTLIQRPNRAAHCPFRWVIGVPDGGQHADCGGFLIQPANLVHGRTFQGNPQVIQFFHLPEIKWLYLPATAEQHLHVALPL